MLRFLYALIAILVGMVLLLSSVYALWLVTERVMQIAAPALRVLAVAGELAFGILILFASLSITLRLMVHLLAPRSASQTTA